MLLTIGMPTYDDYHGVWATLQSMRLSEDLRDCEIIVIDQNPDSPHGAHVAKLCEKIESNLVHGMRYIPYTDIIGNAAAKNRIFAEARGEWVLAMDCHILMRSGTIDRLKEFIKANRESEDLYQGPYITPGHFTPMTHWEDGWGKGMWGKWASDEQGRNRELPPFEIDGMGGGWFAARRASWLPFHSAMRGFGGESMYLQRKYIDAGRKVWCLPWACWLHRHGQPDGVPFPLRTVDLARNLMIGHLELHLPLDDMHAHYIGERNMSQAEWDSIEAEARAAVQAD